MKVKKVRITARQVRKEASFLHCTLRVTILQTVSLIYNEEMHGTVAGKLRISSYDMRLNETCVTKP